MDEKGLRDARNQSKRQNTWLFWMWGVMALFGLMLLATGQSGLAAPLAQSTVALPIIYKEYPSSPTSTNTATLTATSTGTVATPTPTNTNTGTPPTPTVTHTVTGTITPNPGVVVRVSPASAKVNETLTFIITITNPGLAPALNAILSDSFPTYIDVTNVTATEGSITRGTHSVSVSIGTIAPGDTISVIIDVKVNTGATRTETVTNIVTLTYDVGKSKTGSVSYRVEAGSTLPGTGEISLEEAQSRGVDISLLFLAGTLVLAGIFALWYAIWARSNPTPAPRWLPAAGLLVIAAALVVGGYGVGLWPAPSEPKVTSQPIAAANTPQHSPTATKPPQQLAGYSILPAFPGGGGAEYIFQTPEAVVTLPSYPVPSPTLAATEAGQEPPDTSAIVRLEIPALEVNAVVKYVPFDGTTWLISGLREEIAWLGDTSWPGLGGNTVLAGHVTVRGLGNGPFRYLDQLATGDTVTVYTEKNVYTYRVREQSIVGENDLWVTEGVQGSQLTLVTCTDWSDEFKLYVRRLVIFADLEKTEPIGAVGGN